MAKIGVIGDSASVLGFKAFGLETFACEDVSEAVHILHRIAKEGYGIIYITERFYKDMQDDVAKYFDMRVPAIIPIPGKEGPSGAGMDSLRKSVERAVGADILFGGEN